MLLFPGSNDRLFVVIMMVSLSTPHIYFTLKSCSVYSQTKFTRKKFLTKLIQDKQNLRWYFPYFNQKLLMDEKENFQTYKRKHIISMLHHQQSTPVNRRDDAFFRFV